jgi:hypothetical protein
MIIVGCDYHPGFQQIAFVDTDTCQRGDVSTAIPEQIVTTMMWHECDPGLKWFCAASL